MICLLGLILARRTGRCRRIRSFAHVAFELEDLPPDHQVDGFMGCDYDIESAFKDLKDDLSLRPIFHQLEHRIEAHIFVSFLAYCLHVSLRAHLRRLAPGLTPRAVLEKFSQIQMLDVHFPTTDGRELVFRRYTQPERDQKMLLAQLEWELPPQSPPKITAKDQLLEPEPAL